MDIAAAIGIEPWSSGPCCGELGQFLVYQGTWTIDGFAYPQGGLYTNVTVTIPLDLPPGTALLSVAMFQVYSVYAIIS
jgi:Nis1 family